MSRATDLTAGSGEPGQGLFRRDLELGQTLELHSLPSELAQCVISSAMLYPDVSSDGRFAAYYGQSSDSGESGVFRVDAQSGRVERMNVSCSGAYQDGSVRALISGDGSLVAFLSSDPGLWTSTPKAPAAAFLRGPGLPCASLEAGDALLSAGREPVPLHLAPARSTRGSSTGCSAPARGSIRAWRWETSCCP